MSFSEIKIPSERGNENSGCIAKTFSSERRLCIFVFHNGSGNILKRIERTYAKRKISRIVPDSQVVIITILYDGFAV